MHELGLWAYPLQIDDHYDVEMDFGDVVEALADTKSIIESFSKITEMQLESVKEILPPFVKDGLPITITWASPVVGHFEMIKAVLNKILVTGDVIEDRLEQIVDLLAQLKKQVQL